MGVHLITDNGEKHNYAVKLAFKTTNNEAEYEALFFNLTIANSLGTKEVEVRVDSQVVVSQVQGEFASKSEKLKKYLMLIEVECFKYFQIQQIPRAKNHKVNKLARTTSAQESALFIE